MVCLFNFSFSCSEALDNRTININLDNATDDEIANAINELVAEQKARITTKLSLDQAEITLAKGKTQKLVPTVIDLKEGIKVSKTVWESSNTKIAKVQNGVVTGVDGGNAKITCTVVLSDGLELVNECNVTVIVAATAISIKPNSITLGINQTQKLDPVIKPDNVSSKKLAYSSDNANIISVDENGTIKAEHGGKATITISTTDGSNKSTKVTVYAPSIATKNTDYSVTSKSGKTITLDYYGTRSNLNVSTSGKAANVYHSLSGNTLTLTVTPNSYGKVTINISDKSDSKSKVALNVQVEHSAVYDKTSYPSIQYDSASRYPSSYKGDNVSFNGRVLQVMSGWGETSYRISSRGRWNNVVYVTIKNSDITTPIIEDDNVTVYGKYDGNYTYKSILGASITIPSVTAEKINVK